MVRDIYSARYMLFMMGSMGVYAGLVYNDYFSLGLNLFGSNYEFLSEESGSKVPMHCPTVCVCVCLFYALYDPQFACTSSSLCLYLILP
jgi:V-type ATPase 116kDa subunit family